jgi:hypothetical protein
MRGWQVHQVEEVAAAAPVDETRTGDSGDPQRPTGTTENRRGAHLVLTRAQCDDPALEVRRVATLRKQSAAQVDRPHDIHVHVAPGALPKRSYKLLEREVEMGVQRPIFREGLVVRHDASRRMGYRLSVDGAHGRPTAPNRRRPDRRAA